MHVFGGDRHFLARHREVLGTGGDDFLDQYFRRAGPGGNAQRARLAQRRPVDVGGALLTPSGRPDTDYFTVDGLHMNARGYSVWNGIVDRWLKPAAPVEKVADRGAATS